MSLEGSGGRVRRRSPAAIEDVPAAIRGVELEMWQLGRERRDWSIVQAHLNDVVVMSGEMAAPFAAAGAAEDSELSFVLRFAGDRGWTMNGHVMESGEVALLGRSAELTSTAKAPVHWLALQLAPETLYRYSESIAGLGTYSRRGETHLLKPTAQAMNELRCVLAATAAHAARDQDMFATAGAQHALQAQLMHALVLCLGIEPEPLRSNHERVAQQAMAYLRDHEREAIYIADLCLATGISERWLREAFHAVYGTSPMRMLRLRRLNQVHRALLSDLPAASSVTEVAMSYGFFDLGRFAASYREIFGESPSATLQKCAKAAAIA